MLVSVMLQSTLLGIHIMAKVMVLPELYTNKAGGFTLTRYVLSSAWKRAGEARVNIAGSLAKIVRCRAVTVFGTNTWPQDLDDNHVIFAS